MGVVIYYGNIADATPSAGDVGFETQYPVANAAILNKNIYSKWNGDDIQTGAASYTVDLIKVNFGAATAITSCVFDVSSLAIVLDAGDPTLISNVDVILYGSADNYAHNTAIKALIEETPAANTFSKTYTDIYAETFASASYQYYKISLVITLSGSNACGWDVSGNLLNLYLGSYLSLPDPDFYPRSLTHNTKINTSYTGLRSGQDTQGQRKAYNMVFDNLSETEKDNIISFDDDTGGGAYPVYIEHTSLIDAFFARVIGGLEIVPTAYQNYRCAMNIEEEL